MSDSEAVERRLVEVERRDSVAILHLNDPERRNAMSEAMGRTFHEEVTRLAADPGLRAVVLTGRGRAFSAGGDLDMIQARADEARARPGLARRSVREQMRSFYGLFLCVRELPCPSIAAINGHAIGAGLCVALGCDVRYVATEARVGLNFTKIGLHPGMGASWTLPRLVGPERAAELLYTSRIVSGEQAAGMGLASRALPAEEVLPAALETAAEIAACAPLAVRGLKRGLARSEAVSLDDQLGFEAREQSVQFESDDVLEGIAAARERRSPAFRGR